VLYNECLELSHTSPLYSWGARRVHGLYPLKARKRDIIKRMSIIIIIIIIIIIGATRTISKSFRKYVSNIPGNHEVKELQKTAIMDTAHILRKVLT
jgi:hypothetical protein